MAWLRTFWSALLPTPSATLAYILSGGLSVAIAALEVAPFRDHR